MEKRDYIDLIKVAEAIIRLDNASKVISGCGLDEGVASEVFCVWDILRRNAAPKFRYTKNLDQDSDNYQAFAGILENQDLSHEEKYNRLMAN